MRRTLKTCLAVAMLFMLAAPAQAGCAPDKYGGLVCGDGKAAMRVFADTTSPSKRFAFAWRAPDGVPTGTDFPDTGEVENYVVRLEDGAVIAKLGGNYWDNGEAHANRYDVTAVWSPDSRAVLEISNDRWDTYSLAVVLLGADDKATTVDMRAAIEPALKARLPARLRDSLSFQVVWDKKVTLDGRGAGQLTAMLYVPKEEPTATYEVKFAIVAKAGNAAARIVSINRLGKK